MPLSAQARRTPIIPMALSGFHPVVAAWFRSAFGAATEVQQMAWPCIHAGRSTLIAAPTGSGKTLAAFLVALDTLFRTGLEQGWLPDETFVVYVSPLKALSTDIHLNLSIPREGIIAEAVSAGLAPPRITTAIRTGDTSASQRAAMTRRPPHILVTTPESLYLLLTARRSREMLRSARLVIVDEIHAVLPSRRGAHLALSLERLAHVARHPLQRIGLSATQRPVKTVARFLVGGAAAPADLSPDCAIVDLGHRRATDLGLELPSSPLEAVMPHEVWAEIYDRLAELASSHKTTLVFVNARRMAERVARHLAERLGDDAVAAHHGSLAQDRRQDAERRLRSGSLKVLVATASLELGIDIGAVELVCQIGSPHSISTFLQRVGRAGHHIGGISKGRLFPLTRDDLLECAALLSALAKGELEHAYPVESPLDVLAQQVVAESAAEDWSISALFDLVRRAYPYRALSRAALDEIIGMLAHGFVTERGRRGALLYHDGVNQRIKGRPAARLVALTSGGTIPDNADYRVVQEPQDTYIGSVNEDFAVESITGDIFQLGNTAWRIRRIASGVVRVEDAQGAPPTIPFWFGEAPNRSDELSAAVSRLRADAEHQLRGEGALDVWIRDEYGLPETAAGQLAEYLATSFKLLGALPTQEVLMLERFFDDSGGMQLVLHAPFGARVNRAWGLALRKRFCRKFNFELQAAATENAILLSLGPQHSFPLADVYSYLKPAMLRDTLVQAVLDAPMFQTRWRWNLNIALAVPRRRGGKKVPPPLQRMQAEDILVAVFPDAAACLENIAGEREVPPHPLVDQTLADCLGLAMDYGRLQEILTGIEDGELRCLTCDAVEPSPLAHEVLTASPYAFLDDAPLEERRSQAVHRRRAFEPTSGDVLGALDPAAIARVRQEVRPAPRDADALHDVLLTAGWLPAGTDVSWTGYFQELVDTGRATRGLIRGSGKVIWLPAERVHEALALWDLELQPALAPMAAQESRQEAAQAFVRGVLETSGPITSDRVADVLGVAADLVDGALLALESQGDILRGRFTPDAQGLEWCHRRLLARMHRYTIGRLRAEISPTSVTDFMRFLFAWQKAAPGRRAAGVDGLYGVITQLDGYALQAAAWEADVLSVRVEDFDPGMLDSLCFTGRVGWGRSSRSTALETSAGPVRSTPIALFLRAHAPLFTRFASDVPLSPAAQRVLEILSTQGASFMPAIIAEGRMLPTQVEDALGELVNRGLVSADGFAGLRYLLTPVDRRRNRGRRSRETSLGMEAAGRWSLAPPKSEGADVETLARILLRRYGVVFRRLLVREVDAPPWRDLMRVYWRLEARGEIRGGRFVAGAPGEQFALPEAVGLLRNVRRNDALVSEPIGISAADPLNLAGIVGPGPRIPALASNRVLYRRGVVVASLVGGAVSYPIETDASSAGALKRALLVQPESEAFRAYFGRARRPAPRWQKKNT